MPLDPVAQGDPHVPAHNAERAAINQLETDVADRIPFPSGAAYGDLLWYDGINWMTTQTRYLEGEGRPEGVVAAPVGSRYHDTVGAQGAVEWTKKAGGDTNQGWICLAGDTGARNITSLVDIGNGTVHKCVLLRVGQTVEFYIDLTMPSNRTSPYTALAVPNGFRPQYERYGGLQDNKEGADTNGTRVLQDGSIIFLGIVSSKRDRYNGHWLTADAWPNTLPGVAL